MCTPSTSWTESRASHENTINDLPPEMLEKIFSYLHYEELCLVRDVSKLWREWSYSALLLKTDMYNVSKWDNIKDVIKFLSINPTLRGIRIENKTDSETFLITVALCKFCKKLGRIHFKNSHVDQKSLEMMFKQLPRIRSFGSEYYYYQTEYDYLDTRENNMKLQMRRSGSTFHERARVVPLASIAECCPLLCHIDVRYSWHDCKNLFQLLARRGQQLQSLQFSSNNLRLGAEDYFKRNSSVSQRSLKSYYISKDLLESIGCLLQLRKLGLIACRNTSKYLVPFFTSKMFSEIEELDLRYFDGKCEDFLGIIDRYIPNIRKLRLYIFPNYDMNIGIMKTLRNLEHLELLKYSNFPRDWVTDLLECKKLKYLILRNCKDVQNSYIAELVINLELQYLELSCCISLTGKLLEHIPLCKSLRTLVVENCKFSLESIRYLSLQMRSTTISIDNVIFERGKNITKKKLSYEQNSS